MREDASAMTWGHAELQVDLDAYSVPTERSAVSAYLRVQQEGRALLSTKRLLDLAGGLLLATVFSPVMLLAAIAIRRSGAQVLYKHRRIGRGGRPFDCYKFQTMVPNADAVLSALLEKDSELREEWVRDQKLRNDPRITSFGKFLRKTSLDELPQLWNVFRGEMSLVGPRPVVAGEMVKYGRAAKYYLALTPGLTGLWQVTGRNHTSYARRVALDRKYAQTASLYVDIKILLKTVYVVLFRHGAF